MLVTIYGMLFLLLYLMHPYSVTLMGDNKCCPVCWATYPMKPLRNPFGLWMTLFPQAYIRPVAQHAGHTVIYDMVITVFHDIVRLQYSYCTPSIWFADTVTGRPLYEKDTALPLEREIWGTLWTVAFSKRIQLHLMKRSAKYLLRHCHLHVTSKI